MSVTQTAEDHAWVLTFGTKATHIAGLQSGIEDREKKGMPVARFTNAVYLEPEAWPSYFHGRYDLGDINPAYSDSPPPLFKCGRLVIATETFVDTVRSFDLGQTHFPPSKMLKKDREATELEGQFYCLALAEKKSCLLLDRSTSVYKSGREYSIEPKEHDPVVLSWAALSGPEIWKEERISISNLFVSDRLGRPLIDRGWKEDLHMHRCIVDAGAEE